MIRRVYRERIPEFTAAHREVLLVGKAHLRPVGFYRRGGLNLAAVRLAWEELREKLLAEWIAAHPGTRPWAWWALDAPEPRRRLIEGYDAAGDPEAAALTQTSFCGWYSSIGWEELVDPPIIETEAAYLARHGLLTQAEQQALGPDFPREEPMCERLELTGPPTYRTTEPPHKEREGA